MLGVDSLEYEILARAVEAVAGLDQNALSCEIGLREGGGTKYMIDALWNTDQKNRTHITIDPYGNIDYVIREGNVGKCDYTNMMRNKCIRELYQYTGETHSDQLNILNFVLEDTEFFKRYSDGVPVYSEVKRIADKYAVVHFDGPHGIEPLKVEVEFFISRLLTGSTVVFDDIDSYNHIELESWLFDNYFELMEYGTRKASYKYLGN